MEYDINLKYLHKCQQDKYSGLVGKEIDFKPNLNVEIYENAYILPVRTDSDCMMGAGGALDCNGNYIPLSAIQSGGGQHSTAVKSEAKRS